MVQVNNCRAVTVVRYMQQEKWSGRNYGKGKAQIDDSIETLHHALHQQADFDRLRGW